MQTKKTPAAIEDSVGLLYQPEPIEQNFSGIVRQFQQQQLQMTHLSQRQNTALTRMLATMVILVIVILGLAAFFLYSPLRQMQSNLRWENELHQMQLSRKILVQQGQLRKDYDKDIQRLYAQGKESQKELFNMLARVTQSYQQKIIDLEKQNQALAQTIKTLRQTMQQLTTDLTKAELAHLKLENQGKDWQRQIAKLQQQIAHYQKQIAKWKKRVAETLGPEQLELLGQDKNDDG